MDVARDSRVAIKKITRPFDNCIHAKRTYRELRLLKHMDHENVIGLLDVFSPVTSFESFSDIYFVTPFMDINLEQAIHMLSEEQVKFVVYQVLRGLKYIHSAGIIHRDLKPSNLAINGRCELKILDFGLARHHVQEMTGYVATRWYRAPDIILNWKHYNQAMDIWSVGCIMAELLTSRVLFHGNDAIDQVRKILEVCGPPDEEFMENVTDEATLKFLRENLVEQVRTFEEILAGSSVEAIDFVAQMLALDPRVRPTAEFALTHPYLTEYHDESDEPIAHELFDDSLEHQQLSLDQWKAAVWGEILSFVPPELALPPGH